MAKHTYTTHTNHIFTKLHKHKTHNPHEVRKHSLPLTICCSCAISPASPRNLLLCVQPSASCCCCALPICCCQMPLICCLKPICDLLPWPLICCSKAQASNPTQVSPFCVLNFEAFMVYMVIT